MTDRERFLERWSRKKVEAEREAADAPGRPPADTNIPEKKQAETAPGQQAETPAKPPATTPPASTSPKHEFDLASLPSLESITSATDIRAFLSPGVPAELARAALRRAWAADPAIRDFVGLAENSWDFTDPAAIPGFGEIPPGYDIKEMISRIFGDPSRKEEEAIAGKASETVEPAQAGPEDTAAIEESAAPKIDAQKNAEQELPMNAAHASGIPEAMPENLNADVVQRTNNIATQHSTPEAPAKNIGPRRQHGGALPKV